MLTGGVVSEAFKIVFGNSDVMMGLIGFIIIISIMLITIDMYKQSRF